MTNESRPRLISALPTPFADDGSVDIPAFRELLGHVAPHVDAAFVAGTTGEFPALTDRERIALFQSAVEILGPEHVIAHIGHSSLRQVLLLLDAARKVEVRRFAAISPLFFDVDDAATVNHYQGIVDELDGGSIYAYLFPERTGNTTSPEALSDILAMEGVAGVKLSGAANDLLLQAIHSTPGREVYTGNDAVMREISRLGGAGIVSGCSAAYPEPFARLAEAIATTNTLAIELAEAEITPIVAAVGPSILSLKQVIAVRTGSPWQTRMALPQPRLQGSGR